MTRIVRVLTATALLLTVVVCSHAAPAGAAAPRAQRVVMFTDSVGLGARSALPRAFPPEWEVNVDGEPARFVGRSSRTSYGSVWPPTPTGSATTW